MSGARLRWPETGVVSLLAALTTWVTLLAWSPFHERPSSYLVPLFWLVLVVAAAGTALRAVRLPALLVLLAQVVLVGLWLNHDWAAAQSLGGWVPTSGSLDEVARTLAVAAETSRDYGPPIPKDVSAFAPLLIAAGAGVALAVDLLAAGLRRAPLAGLPLLAVYTAPVSILDGGVSWLKFAVAASLFLALIAAQESARLSRWGHQVSGSGRVYDTQQTQVSSRAVWSSARKIGLTSVALAVVVPVLVPTMSLGLLSGPGAGLGGDGDAVSVTNPMVNMRRDLTRGLDVDQVLVNTDDPDPRYLRLAVLDVYDGDAWRSSRRDIPVTQRAEGIVPRPPGLDPQVDRRRHEWGVQVLEGFASRWLPAPYPVFSIDAPGDWRYDRDTLDFVSASKDQDTEEGLGYVLERLEVTPTAEQLAFAAAAPAAVFGPNTELPRTVPDSVRELAADVARGARSKHEMAVLLQRWFRVDGGFEYDLEPDPGNGVDDLENFLFRDRRGYCEQYAAAMALMGRSLGIPSRVAVGYLRPDPVGEGQYVYSAHDMHAWPEMYFDDVGWVRFEPTPGARTGSNLPAYTEESVQRERPSASAGSSAAAPSGPNRIDETTAAVGGGNDSGTAGLSTPTMLISAASVLLLLALIGSPRALRAWVRRRRWESATTAAELAEAAWAELRDTALDLGAAWDDDVTVRARARELVRGFGRIGEHEDALGRASERGAGANPEADAALTRLVALVERARYSRGLPASDAQASTVRADVDCCVSALHAGAAGSRRTRATWLPASLWSQWTRSASARRPDAVGLAEPGVDHAI